MKIKRFLSGLSLSVAITMTMAACTSAPKVVYKTSYIVPEVSESLYSTCPKPTTVSFDMGDKDISKVPEEELDVLIMQGYANTKADHVACYKTLVNVKAAIDELRNTVSKGND